MVNYVKKEKRINWFFKEGVWFGYKVVEAKLYHKNCYWLRGQNAYMEP